MWNRSWQKSRHHYFFSRVRSTFLCENRCRDSGFQSYVSSCLMSQSCQDSDSPRQRAHTASVNVDHFGRRAASLKGHSVRFTEVLEQAALGRNSSLCSNKLLFKVSSRPSSDHMCGHKKVWWTGKIPESSGKRKKKESHVCYWRHEGKNVDMSTGKCVIIMQLIM